MFGCSDVLRVKMKLKSGYRWFEGDQVPTRPVTVEEIMSSSQFALGAADARAGRGYRSAYTSWDINGQWNYERGRQWAAVTPRSVTLKHSGKVTNAAKDWYRRDDII
jgi:hypothetical protein